MKNKIISNRKMEKTMVQENDSMKNVVIPEKRLEGVRNMELNLCPVCIYSRMVSSKKGGYMCASCWYMTHPYNFYENETEKFKERKNLFMENNFIYY